MFRAGAPDYDDTVEGNITKYTCVGSYEFRSGNPFVSIVCQANGTWQDFPEVCVGKYIFIARDCFLQHTKYTLCKRVFSITASPLNLTQKLAHKVL